MNLRREPRMFDRITFDPAILGGKPIVKGTRISVEFILELLASGGSIAGIVRNDPFLTEEYVRQAARFAAQSLKNDIDMTAGCFDSSGNRIHGFERFPESSESGEPSILNSARSSPLLSPRLKSP